MIGQWDKSFLQIVQQILMADWDPIGVKDCPEAADEYDSYAMRDGAQVKSRSTLQTRKYDAMGIGTERRSVSPLLPVAEHLMAEWEKFCKQKSAD